MGWGLSRGRGWLFYLLAVLWHFFLNYTVVLFQTGILGSLQVEFLIALMADGIFFLTFWLRWRTIKFTELSIVTPEQPVGSTDSPEQSVGKEPVENAIQPENTQPQKEKSIRSEEEESAPEPKKAAEQAEKNKPGAADRS